jgi:hypothetical protein
MDIEGESVEITTTMRGASAGVRTLAGVLASARMRPPRTPLEQRSSLQLPLFPQLLGNPITRNP